MIVLNEKEKETIDYLNKKFHLTIDFENMLNNIKNIEIHNNIRIQNYLFLSKTFTLLISNCESTCDDCYEDLKHYLFIQTILLRLIEDIGCDNTDGIENVFKKLVKKFNELNNRKTEDNIVITVKNFIKDFLSNIINTNISTFAIALMQVLIILLENFLV